MIRCVHLSDTHGCEPEVPEADILIHTGDFSGHGTEKDVIRFNKWLGSLPHAFKIVTAGNHDIVAQEEPALFRALMTNATVLLDEAVSVLGVRIYGSPWSVEFGRWAFMLPEIGLRSVYDTKMHGEIDILATHGPAYGKLDTVFRYKGSTCEFEPESVGSTSLEAAIARVKPRFVLCGHIHEAYGKIEEGGVTYLNSSVLDERYRHVNKPQVFEIAPRAQQC